MSWSLKVQFRILKATTSKCFMPSKHSPQVTNPLFKVVNPGYLSRLCRDRNTLLRYLYSNQVQNPIQFLKFSLQLSNTSEGRVRAELTWSWSSRGEPRSLSRSLFTHSWWLRLNFWFSVNPWLKYNGKIIKTFYIIKK